MNSSLFLSLLLLLLAAGFIYWACEFFVNGIEWIGRLGGISQNAVGTVLAAFGTALPESAVTFVAVVLGKSAAARNIGVGAALGGPLVLATIAYPVIGLMIWLTRAQPPTQRIELDRGRLARDQLTFLATFVCKIALGFLVFTLKPALGWLFLAVYVLYTWLQIRHQDEQTEGALHPLKLQRRAAQPSLLLAVLQTLAALVVIFAASHLFVQQLAAVGPALGMSSTVVALLLSPIATELPETMNAIIWIRQGKQRLALANISGAMMIQATVPTALGLWFTPWLFDAALAWSAVITTVAVIGLLLLLWRDALTPRRLTMFAVLYLVFAAGLAALWRGGSLG